MTVLNFRHISFFYRKFGSVTYQICVGWIRYPDEGHIENSIFHLVCGSGIFLLLQEKLFLASTITINFHCTLCIFTEILAF